MDHSRVVLEHVHVLRAELSLDDRAPLVELRRGAPWMILPAPGHRAEHQLHLVAVAVSVGVMRKECRPACRLLLLGQRHGIDTLRSSVPVFRRNVLEQNVPIKSAEGIESDRSLTPGRCLDVQSGVWPDVVAHRAKRALRRKSPDIVERLHGRRPAATAELGDRTYSGRWCHSGLWRFRPGPNDSADCDESSNRSRSGERDSRSSLANALLIVRAHYSRDVE